MSSIKHLVNLEQHHQDVYNSMKTCSTNTFVNSINFSRSSKPQKNGVIAPTSKACVVKANK